METIQKLLHINARVSSYNATKLPLYLRNAYKLSLLRIADMDCLLAKPDEDINLTSLRKQRIQLMKLTGLECVIHFVHASTYIKRKLTEEGVPFIIEGKDVYLPFLGIALSHSKDRVVKAVEKISFSTQRLLLTALYQHWNGLNLSGAAKVLNVSKMTISRCYNQIQAVGLPFIQKTDKECRFVWEDSPQAYWSLIGPHLRNPVKQEYRLDTPIPIGDYLPGGMTALCQYSMLNDNTYPTYAITALQEKELALQDVDQVPEREQPMALIQVMQYAVHFRNGDATDPITAFLSLKKQDREDPRVTDALNEILEEQVYGQRH